MVARVWIQRSLFDAVPPDWLAGLEPVPFAGTVLPAASDGRAVGLALRSTAQVTGADLARLPALRVVATASSGTDHLDEAALTRAGVALITGRGGNAAAVADWVEWALGRSFAAPLAAPLSGRRVVVVGVGAVGACVADRLLARGAEVALVDPPRAARDRAFVGVSLAQALGQPCAALTLHVPLTRGGDHATAGLIGAVQIAQLAGAVVLNAARGGVLDEAAALPARRSDQLAGLYVDTFVGEPAAAPDMVRGCDAATPHIAGHSREGRLRVVWLAMDGLRRHLGLAGLPPLADCVHELRRDTPADSASWHPFSALDGSARRFVAAVAGRDFSAVRAAHYRLELAACRGPQASQ